MKKIVLLICSLFLVLCPIDVYADSQSTTVMYSVPAVVKYVDYDGSSTVQKVDVGTLLKAPSPKGRSGYVFEGWIDSETGMFFDFSKPVTNHLNLRAQYSVKKKSEINTGVELNIYFYWILFLISFVLGKKIWNHWFES